MKRLLISTFALALLAAVPAAGAPNDRHHGGGHHQAQSQSRGAAHANRANWQAHRGQGVVRSRAVWSGRGHGGNAIGYRARQTNVQFRHRAGVNMRSNAVWSVHRSERRGYRNSTWTARGHRSSLRYISDRHDNNRQDNGRHDYNRHQGNYGRSDRSSHPVIIEQRHSRPQNWNARPRHFDARTYRRNFEAQHRFHWRAYNRPNGWYAHRWTYGERLPRIFWVRDYWVTDWWSFDLPQPPYGYEWVRYGDDALLVNIDTGEVLEVEYDLFE